MRFKTFRHQSGVDELVDRAAVPLRVAGARRRGFFHRLERPPRFALLADGVPIDLAGELRLGGFGEARVGRAHADPVFEVLDDDVGQFWRFRRLVILVMADRPDDRAGGGVSRDDHPSLQDRRLVVER